MKSDDELLDEITAYLRNEPVPEMPQHIVLGRRRARHWAWLLAAAGTVAACFGGLILWRVLPDVNSKSAPSTLVQQAPVAVEKSKIVVLQVDLARPIGELETQLDHLEEELAELRWQASLLDARRKADELLAQF